MSTDEFLIIPAVDVKGGRCVRLWRGLADRETVFDEDPVRAATRWKEEGAELLHVVDLDGAFEGEPVNDRIIRRIAAEVDIPIEVGGGIRNTEAARSYVDNGVARVIVGTAAFRDPAWLAEIASELGDKLVVGMDVTKGKVAVHGWLGASEEEPADALARLAEAGVRRIIYTDTMMDGTLEGPNLAGIRAVASASPIPIIASGGVSSIADILEVAELHSLGVEGIITGMALYKGGFTLAEAIASLRTRSL